MLGRKQTAHGLAPLCILGDNLGRIGQKRAEQIHIEIIECLPTSGGRRGERTGPLIDQARPLVDKVLVVIIERVPLKLPRDNERQPPCIVCAAPKLTAVAWAEGVDEASSREREHDDGPDRSPNGHQLGVETVLLAIDDDPRSAEVSPRSYDHPERGVRRIVGVGDQEVSPLAHTEDIEPVELVEVTPGRHELRGRRPVVTTIKERRRMNCRHLPRSGVGAW